ncbi:MAG: translation initiation factor IF-2, partial [Acutalibacteraceae bacterium]|nr:translation initiation factor IF-2 [Acutalibacteraceae bacterium]
MINKYRVHEVAKDFDVSSKSVLELLGKHFEGQKKSMTALEENELDVIFEVYTKENSVESFDAYFATANEPKKEEKAEEPKAEEKVAEKVAEVPAEKGNKDKKAEPAKQ